MNNKSENQYENLSIDDVRKMSPKAFLKAMHSSIFRAKVETLFKKRGS